MKWGETGGSGSTRNCNENIFCGDKNRFLIKCKKSEKQVWTHPETGMDGGGAQQALLLNVGLFPAERVCERGSHSL